jgi:hypothetical protein
MFLESTKFIYCDLLRVRTVKLETNKTRALTAGCASHKAVSIVKKFAYQALSQVFDLP